MSVLQRRSPRLAKLANERRKGFRIESSDEDATGCEQDKVQETDLFTLSSSDEEDERVQAHAAAAWDQLAAEDTRTTARGRKMTVTDMLAGQGAPRVPGMRRQEAAPRVTQQRHQRGGEGVYNVVVRRTVARD